ncbi:MAG: DUF692 family protein, partial [Gammaproteobacteria bacterium]|nr:DUF692 family protein [Gammaproteobacteria bacterium]
MQTDFRQPPHLQIHGAGLGLRREHLGDLLQEIPKVIRFFELAPENWMELGGYRRECLQQLAQQRPFVA